MNRKPLFSAAARICFAASGFEGEISITGISADAFDIVLTFWVWICRKGTLVVVSNPAPYLVPSASPVIVAGQPFRGNYCNNDFVQDVIIFLYREYTS